MNESKWPGGLSAEHNELLTIAAGIVAIAVFLLYIYYLISLNSVLKTVRPFNRKMPPAQVWFLLLAYLSPFAEVLLLFTSIPFLAITIIKYLILAGAWAWQVYTSLKISRSIKAEFDSRGIAVEEAPTWKWAVNYCFASLVQIPLSIHSGNTWYILIAWLWLAISWIAYWAETAKYKKELRALPATPDSDSQLFHNLY